MPGKKWTREEVRVLDTTGLFEGQNYELVGGELASKMGKLWTHVRATKKVHDRLDRIFGDNLVYTEAPIDVAIDDNRTNEPQPDVVVLSEPPSHLHNNPQPTEIALLVEVADSSLRVDTTTKAALYARAGIPDYWVLDLNGRRLIVYREPVDGEYSKVLVYQEHESVSPLARPGAQIQVADVLP